MISDVKFDITNEYDENNNLIKVIYDKNADNKADRIHKYEYDKKGNKIRIQCDYNVNENIEK